MIKNFSSIKIKFNNKLYIKIDDFSNFKIIKTLQYIYIISIGKINAKNWVGT